MTLAELAKKHEVHPNQITDWKRQLLNASGDALEKGPEIVNTGQGSQFTAENFVNAVSDRGCRISMDGRGAGRDNIFIERFWCTLKYDEVYLHARPVPDPPPVMRATKPVSSAVTQTPFMDAN